MSSIVHSLVRINKLGLNEYLSLKNNFGEARQELKFLVPRNLMPQIVDFLSENYSLCLSADSQMTHFYLSKYFVELHNGKISLESEINQGSTFTVELPMEGL